LDQPTIFYTISNIQQKLHKKKKKRSFVQWAAWILARRPAYARSAHNRAAQTARLLGPRALGLLTRRADGPLGHGPRGRRARAPLSAWSLTSGSRSSVSPPSLTAVLPPLRRPLAGSSAPARARTSTAPTLRLQSYHSRTLSRSLSTSTTQMADGRVGRREPGTKVR